MIVILNRNASKFYIGRGSHLGNPFSWKKGTLAKYSCKERSESLVLYEKWLLKRIKEQDKDVCKALNDIYKACKAGKQVQLICYCAPSPCHGDIIKRIVMSKLPK